MQMPVQTPESIMSAPILSNQTAYSKKSISNFRRKLYQKQTDEGETGSQTRVASSVPRQNRFVDQSVISHGNINNSASINFSRINNT